MWRGRWGAMLLMAMVALGASRPVSAETLTPEQMLARADAVVQRAQLLYDKALAALTKAQASGDPSAIADANNVLTTVKGVLKKAERDRLALKEAMAGNLEDARNIFEGIVVAEEALNAVDGALASIGGPGIDASIEGSDSVDLGTDDGQPSLDSTNPLSGYMGAYVDWQSDRTGYVTDTGDYGNSGDSGTSAGDDLWQGSPTGSAIE